MRLISVTIAVAFVTACGGAQTPRYQQSMPAVYVVEEKPLPPPPDSKPIAKDKDWVVPLMKDEKAPGDGILMSDEKAARAKNYQIGYKEIRGMYEADRKVWKHTRIIYEDRIKEANKEIAELQPSWWDKNKTTLGFVAGVIIGSATAIGIAHSLK